MTQARKFTCEISNHLLSHLAEGHKYWQLLSTLVAEGGSKVSAQIRNSKSQLYQDLFVLMKTRFKQGGFFVEFGATNGVSLSNTYLLEKNFGWKGLLAEPAKCWHQSLVANRGVSIDFDCVWSSTGFDLMFNETKRAALSTIASFSEVDHHSEARKEGKSYAVRTVSLNDLLDRYHAPPFIDYLSIDTEGSEFEILNSLDFNRWQFGIITVEHNRTQMRDAIQTLLSQKGYVRWRPDITQFDDWYVLHPNPWARFRFQWPDLKKLRSKAGNW